MCSIHIQLGKEHKDRNSILSKYSIDLLRSYYRENRPKKHLFEGQDGKKHLGSNVLTIVKRAGKRAGLKHAVKTQSLRHSFAINLLEDGVDKRYIQNLLGHNSSKTTEIYTFVATKHLKTIKNLID